MSPLAIPKTKPMRMVARPKSSRLDRKRNHADPIPKSPKAVWLGACSTYVVEKTARVTARA